MGLSPGEVAVAIGGIATFVNSALMWPTIRGLKALVPRVEALEAQAKRPARKKKLR